jgi:hypothetical protein
VDFWAWGQDWTGDRLADLLVVSRGKLLVFARSGGRTLFESRPRRSVPLGAAGAEEDRSVQVEVGTEGVGVDAFGDGAPQLADLDGDGRPEVCFFTRSRRGRGVVRIVWLR